MKLRVVSAFFTSSRLYSSSVTIRKEIMRDLGDWPDSLYELMFATKEGLPIPRFPISHSAIALRNPQDETFSVYGRQSPFDYSQWLRDGFHIRTAMSNEKPYLHPKFNFTGYPTNVFFSKDEILGFLKLADEIINQKQSCNMVFSNCYSYSVTVMTLAIKTLLTRPVFDSAAALRILNVMDWHPLNDHASIGVLNNSQVVNSLHAVLSEIHARFDKVTDIPKDDALLFEKASTLLFKLEMPAQSEKNTCSKT